MLHFMSAVNMCNNLKGKQFEAELTGCRIVDSYHDITKFGEVGLPFNYIPIKWLRAIGEKLKSFKQIALSAQVRFVEVVPFVLKLLLKPFDMNDVISLIFKSSCSHWKAKVEEIKKLKKLNKWLQTGRCSDQLLDMGLTGNLSTGVFVYHNKYFWHWEWQ